MEKKKKIDNEKPRTKVLMKNKFHIRKNLIQKKKKKKNLIPQFII